MITGGSCCEKLAGQSCPLLLPASTLEDAAKFGSLVLQMQALARQRAVENEVSPCNGITKHVYMVCRYTLHLSTYAEIGT